MARTPLTELHIESGGRMVGFAGYEMPSQFRSGVLSEHLWTRQSAGMFDVSYMGLGALFPRSGRLVDAAFTLERLGSRLIDHLLAA
jgi:aminomethyltransferase